MAEYIEREATVELLRSLGSRDYRREKGTINQAIKMVSYAEYTPAADVEPVRHGRWIAASDMWGGNPDEAYICSVCEEPFVLIEGRPEENYYHYCPNCGAKMDKEDDSDS